MLKETPGKYLLGDIINEFPLFPENIFKDLDRFLGSQRFENEEELSFMIRSMIVIATKCK